MDDDIVSLTALTLIVNHEGRKPEKSDGGSVCIGQMIQSLYLMTQCQLKLHHSVTSLAQTVDYIKVVRRKRPANRTLDKLTRMLIERKLKSYTNALL